MIFYTSLSFCSHGWGGWGLSGSDSGINETIVLEQNKFSKKLPLTGTVRTVVPGKARVYRRVFHKLYENANIGFLSLLFENPKKILPPVGIEPGPLIASDSKSNTILSTLT